MEVVAEVVGLLATRVGVGVGDREENLQKEIQKLKNKNQKKCVEFFTFKTCKKI